MNPHVQKLLAQMDEKNWLRMLVCFMPGLIISKIAGQYPNMVTGVLGIGSLAGGVGIFLAWNRIRGIQADADGEDEEEEDLVAATTVRTGAETARLITELVASCSGSATEALKLIETELLVTPGLTYDDAVEMAFRRKRA